MSGLSSKVGVLLSDVPFPSAQQRQLTQFTPYTPVIEETFPSLGYATNFNFTKQATFADNTYIPSLHQPLYHWNRAATANPLSDGVATGPYPATTQPLYPFDRTNMQMDVAAFY